MSGIQGAGSGARTNFPVSILKMKMDGQKLEGEAAKKLIDSAAQVTQRPNRGAQGTGRRVDVTG